MPETFDFPTGDPAAAQEMVIVAGGGVSGLYCALKLATRPKPVPVLLLEASDRWGGRIETSTLDGFVAEFGPMRYQPKVQPLFDRLVKDLGIGYVDFVGPTAGQLEYPKYDLRGDETDLDALQLLRRGILLLMGRDLHRDPWGRKQQGWILGLTEEDYSRIRREATLPGDGRPLWSLGFWNALSSNGILSHQALMKIRDLGTFYHMIPDNLNAVEWTVWWLRALKAAGGRLVSLEGSSYELIRRLQDRVHRSQWVVTRLKTKVSGFTAAGAQRVNVFVEGRTDPIPARHLILAMPRAPLVKLANHLPNNVRAALDTVNGFPMIKVFFVVEKAWWRCDQPPQTRANRMPTREVHYFRRPEDCPQNRPGDGMVMIYTDRPATEYWRHFVVGDTHDRAQIDQNDHLKKEFARWLAEDALAALRTNGEDASGLILTDEARERFAGLDLEGCASRIESSVKTYAIRDWAREPYGAANHSWQPGVKSWEIQELLAAFALPGGTHPTTHVCGEAYSDYTGFIEGALRTAEAALATIR